MLEAAGVTNKIIVPDERNWQEPRVLLQDFRLVRRYYKPKGNKSAFIHFADKLMAEDRTLMGSAAYLKRVALWENADAKTKDEYERVAQLDKERYLNEVELYQKLQTSLEADLNKAIQQRRFLDAAALYQQLWMLNGGEPNFTVG